MSVLVDSPDTKEFTYISNGEKVTKYYSYLVQVQTYYEPEAKFIVKALGVDEVVKIVREYLIGQPDSIILSVEAMRYVEYIQENVTREKVAGLGVSIIDNQITLDKSTGCVFDKEGNVVNLYKVKLEEICKVMSINNVEDFLKRHG